MSDCFCEKCGKTMNENQFYTYKDGGKTELCKNCLTMHIDNFNPETFIWLLEKMDVPYVPTEWNVIRDKAYAKNPNLNGMSVFGKYLSKMKLKQWNKYGWADTEALQAESEKKAAEKQQQIETRNAYVREQYEHGDISEAEYKTLTSTTEQVKHAPVQTVVIDNNNPYNENYFMDETQMVDLGADLTEEDKLYLAMKWGRLYRPSEWVELEKKYNDMMASFDIQDADTKSTLILICKTDLKMNQCLDQGDLDGYQKLSKVSDTLRKSAKFTAAQNKEEKNDYVDCVGELVALCEKQGFIPRYVNDVEQDKVDLTLKDMESYLYKLVTQDLGFGQQIEDALKKIQLQKEMNEKDAEMPDEDEKEPEELIDEDYQEYYDSIEEQKKIDNTLEEDE